MDIKDFYPSLDPKIAAKEMSKMLKKAK